MTANPEAHQYAIQIIATYGEGQRITGVFEAARAHLEKPASFWVDVLAYVEVMTSETA